jgi:hypothetical protein
MKSLAFPTVTTFPELFAAVEPWLQSPDVEPWPSGTGPFRHLCLKGYGVTYRSYAVKARDHVLDYITSAMIVDQHDRVTFEAIVRDDGVLITATHNRILATRWLAIVDLVTVPDGIAAAEQFVKFTWNASPKSRMTECTLNDTLTALGWTTKPAPGFQGKCVYTDRGRPLGRMTAREVWDLLREKGLLQSLYQH